MAKGDTYTIKLTGAEELEQELRRLNSVRFDAVITKNVAQMFKRAKGNNPSIGGTPVDSGELRKSVTRFEDGIGYTKEYAPHVNFGHRYEKVVNGKKVILWYEGQRFLDTNVKIQGPSYRQDLLNAIKKG